MENCFEPECYRRKCDTCAPKDSCANYIKPPIEDYPYYFPYLGTANPDPSVYYTTLGGFSY